MRNSILLLFLVTHFSCLAQNTISGKIIDSAGAPVPFAVVALLHADDTAIVQGKITDENGAYDFHDVRSGNYFLKISATGYSEAYSPSFYKDSLQDVTVPDLSIGKALQLSAVTISAVTPTVEFSNGNITVNVENSPLARGNSVYDLLYRLPGVSVENNSITIQGKSGVIVMIDGRVQQVSDAQLLNLLKGMSAATIQKIEVLKNPPVKYDAAGTSGMINIVTKRSEVRGFNGLVYNETSQGFYNNTASGIALNYKNEKISIFSGLDGIYDTYLVNTKLYTNFASDSGNTGLGNITGYKAPETGLTYKIGADWDLNKSNIIGFKVDGGPGTYDETGHGKNQITGYDTLGFDHLYFTEIGHNKWNTQNYNVNTEHLFDTTGTVLTFSADHTRSIENDHSYYSNYFYDVSENEVLVPNNYQNTNDANTQIWSSKLDFTHPFASGSTIEAGLKASVTTMQNDYLFEHQNSAGGFYTDSTLTNNYSYSENNFAAYINYSKTFDRLSLNAGFRAERTIVSGSSSANSVRLDRNYFSFFPNISFEYSASDDHTFQLNLNRRIDRPSYWDLTPFIVYRDQYSYFSGNPFLQPDFSNSIELTHSFKDIITNSVSFSHVDHFMLDYTAQNDTLKILLETGKNISFEDSWTYLLFVKYDVANWYEMEFNATAAYISYKGDIKGVSFHTNGLAYRMNLTNSFLLPGKTKLELTGMYRGPNLFGILKIDPLWTVSFAFQRSFCREKLSCSLGLDDAFKTFRFHTHSQFDNQNWNFYQTVDPRRITFSINYNFGKIEIEERDESSSDDEKGRLQH